MVVTRSSDKIHKNLVSSTQQEESGSETISSGGSELVPATQDNEVTEIQDFFPREKLKGLS